MKVPIPTLVFSFLSSCLYRKETVLGRRNPGWKINVSRQTNETEKDKKGKKNPRFDGIDELR